MPFYEIIYETGEHSIACYEDDAEAKRAIGEHVKRAKSGSPATPSSTPRNDLDEAPVGIANWPATRVAKVLVYDKHPNDYADTASNVSADVALKVVKEAIEQVKDESGVVNVQELIAALNETTNPGVESGPHESNFKMKEERELGVPE